MTVEGHEYFLTLQCTCVLVGFDVGQGHAYFLNKIVPTAIIFTVSIQVHGDHCLNCFNPFKP